jgi:hypothetical protein
MSQQGGSAQQGGGGGKGGGRKQPQRLTVAGTSFMASSFTMMSRFLSPYDAFLNYGQAVIALIMLTVLGNAFAFFEGGLIVAETALLIVPSFFLALLSMVTGPFVKPFADAIARSGTVTVVSAGRKKIIIRSTNFIMRPVYDIFALLTVGLPFSLAWFWEGKILATGLSMLGHITNAYFLGAAIAYYATAFTFAGFIFTLTGSYAVKGIFGGLTNVIRSFSFIFSMYAGFIIADIIFFIWMSLPSNIFSFLAPILSFVKLSQFWMTAGALGGFILSMLTVDAFRRVVPNVRRVPVTWNIMALIIGAMGFIGTDFYIYVIVTLAIYMMMLYLISGDGTWLWYTIIAVPSAPAIAYYLGFLTKLLIDYTQAFTVAIILLTALFIVMLVIFAVIIVIIAIPAIMASVSSGPFGAVAGIVALSIAIVGLIIGIAGFISTVVSYIQAVVFLSSAYRILIAPV